VSVHASPFSLLDIDQQQRWAIVLVSSCFCFHDPDVTHDGKTHRLDEDERCYACEHFNAFVLAVLKAHGCFLTDWMKAAPMLQAKSYWSKRPVLAMTVCPTLGVI
jgi:hypothetical protein